MFEKIFHQIKISVTMLLLMTLLTGIIYPMVVTSISKIIFPYQANGSLIIKNKKLMGSVLIGQEFTDKKYFWGRPSATEPFAYNAASSSGSNYGPSNIIFLQKVKNRISHLQQSDLENNFSIPVDLITASASGLDPDMSPRAAFYQVHRIALVRGIPESRVIQLVADLLQSRTWSILGEPRINVLQLNLALDELDDKEFKHV